LPSHTNKAFYQYQDQNDVKIVSKSYLLKSFQAHSEEVQIVINNVVQYFSLNKEQERAFCIVANHAVSPESEQLKMYLGGMSGTGKSQVIKALIHFFNLRNESHCFVALGPTGTSAALLNGSAYHSFLGIHAYGETNTNENITITQLQARLDGVNYIFIDEVSMVACHELYKISSQLAKAKIYLMFLLEE
jgi:PIF1-like helicase